MKQKKNQLFALIQNMANMKAAEDDTRGEVVPVRRKAGEKVSNFTHTLYCKGYFKKLYYYCHKKSCWARELERTNEEISSGR